MTRGITSFQSFKIARSFSSLQNRNITSPRFTSNDGKIEIQNIDTLQDILEEKIMKFSSERSISTEKDNNNVNENIEIFDENVNRSNSFNTKKTKNQSFTTNNKKNDNKNQRDDVKNISFNTSLNCASADSNNNSVIYDNNNNDNNNNSDDNNTNDKINIFSNNNHNNNNINNNNNNSINNNNNNKNKIQKRTSLIFEPWSKNIIKIASKEIFDNDKSQVLELYIDKAINLPENCTVARYDFNFIFTIVTIIIIVIIIITIIIIIIIFTIVTIIIVIMIVVIVLVSIIIFFHYHFYY